MQYSVIFRLTILLLGFLLSGPHLEASSELLTEKSESMEIVSQDFARAEVVHQIPRTKKVERNTPRTSICSDKASINFFTTVNSDLVIFLRRILI